MAVQDDRQRLEADEKKRAADRRQAQETKRRNADAQLTEAENKRQEIVNASDAMMNSSQPTPTQRENDMARLGVPVEHKEDDGSGPDVALTRTVAAAPPGQPGYQTRSAGGPGPERVGEDKDKK